MMIGCVISILMQPSRGPKSGFRFLGFLIGFRVLGFRVFESLTARLFGLNVNPVNPEPSTAEPLHQPLHEKRHSGM